MVPWHSWLSGFSDDEVTVVLSDINSSSDENKLWLVLSCLLVILAGANLSSFLLVSLTTKGSSGDPIQN